MYRLRVKNAAQIVAVVDQGQKHLRGEDQDKVVVYTNATIIVGNDGRIEAVGPANELENDERFKDAHFDSDIDGSGLCVLPGFVDGHTHPVWGGDRVNEFGLKLAGATYMEIHAQGGGIQSTVNASRNLEEEDLLKSLEERLERAVRQGTTLLEAKTGYGLSLDLEVKLLKVLHKATETISEKIELVSTYLGAHSVPPGKTSAEASEDIVRNHIPHLIELRRQNVISPSNIDVFLEKGVFGLEDTRSILQAGKDVGLEINFHGDEINYMGSGELAGELGALAVSHLEKISPEGIAAMSVRPSFAVLLPTTAYILRLHPPPARDLIAGGVPVALGSDFNPNAHCISMPFVMNLACVLMRMTLNEALVAATLNAAASLNKSDEYGSLEKGKFGDLVLLKAPRWEHIIYQLVDPPILHVVKKGRIVFSSSN